MTEEITISLREFARRLGIGEKTIRDGIKSGKITDGVTYDEDGIPKIFYEIALVEVDAIGLGLKARNEKESNESLSNRRPSLKLRNSTSYREAIRIEKIHKAELAELEVKEKKSVLVRRDIVFKQLFEFHRLVRNGLLSIPDRLADELKVITDRDGIHKLIYDSICDELEKLNGAGDMNFKEDDN